MCKHKFGFHIEKPLLIFASHISEKLINHLCVYTYITKHGSQSTVMPFFLQVLVTSLSLQQVDYQEPANFWIGPRAVRVHNC